MKHVSKQAPRKQASRQLLYIVFGFAVCLAGLTGLVYAVMPGRADLGSPAIGGSFTMIGQDGREVTNADLAGRPYLVFFGYTHCPDFCPTALFDISAVFKELGPDKNIGLTGDSSKTETIAKAFRVYAKKMPGEKPGDYTVDHTGVVYLMDKRGKFVSAFNLSRPPQQAARELEAYL